MTIWQTLGIAPTDDVAEIRRAYARQLKKTRPDKDPQGYQVLHEAFELAKRLAAGDADVEIEPLPDTVPNDAEPESLMPGVSAWDRDALTQQAEEMAALLVRDRQEGINALTGYLKTGLPDALAARKAFSLALAQALSRSDDLDETLLNAVSALMMWDLEHYRSQQLPEWLVTALRQQVQHNYDCGYWQQLRFKYQHGWVNRLVWRALSNEKNPPAWWMKWVPGFIGTLRAELAVLYHNHPALISRLHPRLSALADSSLWLRLTNLCLWGGVGVFIGYGAPQYWPGVALMWLVVGFFGTACESLRERMLHLPRWLKRYDIAVDLMALAVLAPFFIRYYHAVRALGDATPNSRLVMGFVLTAGALIFLWFAWWISEGSTHNRGREWDRLPRNMLSMLLFFPARLICSSREVINLLLLILIPLLYGLVIRNIYFT